MRVENPTGWLTVLVAFLALSASFSARSILGLTMPLWESEMGWSRVTDPSKVVTPGQELTVKILRIDAKDGAEKIALGWHLDGRVSAVIGTHTHVPTADHRILPHGTAFMTDAGMTGDYESVIGMNRDEPLDRFMRRIPQGRFEPANGPATLCGVAVESDDNTGLAVKVGPLRIGGRLEEIRPAFWG